MSRLDPNNLVSEQVDYEETPTSFVFMVKNKGKIIVSEPQKTPNLEENMCDVDQKLSEFRFEMYES